MKRTIVLVLAAVMVLGVAGAAFAGSATYNNAAGVNTVSSGPVSISAKVNPKITLTVATTDGGAGVLLLDWASIDPGTDPAAKDVTLTVSSNKDYNITATENFAALAAAGITASRSLASPTAGTKGQNNSHTDSVDLGAVGWDVVPGTYTGSITYTVTQVL